MRKSRPVPVEGAERFLLRTSAAVERRLAGFAARPVITRRRLTYRRAGSRLSESAFRFRSIAMRSVHFSVATGGTDISSICRAPLAA